MKKFWAAIAVALFFYARMDILIWQRIFETHSLYNLGIGVYHWGWIQSLFGFMILGMLVCYPNLRQMVSFPLTLGILAFSGLEDVLYYWLDGKDLPTVLPWLGSNPLLLKPVTVDHLLISAAFWIVFVVLLDTLGERLEKKLKFLWRERGRRVKEEATREKGRGAGEPIPAIESEY